MSFEREGSQGGVFAGKCVSQIEKDSLLTEMSHYTDKKDKEAKEISPGSDNHSPCVGRSALKRRCFLSLNMIREALVAPELTE